jgi:erythromycin esterase-like protein
MNHLSPIILSFLFILSSSAFSKPGVHVVKSLENFSNKEYKHLARLIKDAKIVGIGESGHGSSGFLNARTAIVKKLIVKDNFRLILLEAAYFKTDKVNSYLNSCSKGSQTELEYIKVLKSLAGIYSNIEVKKMISWICDFNKTAEVAVQFHGIDIWEDPWTNKMLIEKAHKFFKKDKLKKLFTKASDNCFAWQIDSWEDSDTLSDWRYLLETWRLPTEEHNICLGSLSNMQTMLSGYKGEKDDDYFWAKQALKVSFVYQTYRDLFVIDFQRVLNLRDDIQAYLVTQWMNKYDNKYKAVLLAHNIHVAKKQSIVVPNNPGNPMKWVDVRSTGENLVAHYGRSYKSIAMSGYRVSSSRDGDYITLDQNDALDYVLQDHGDILIVDPSVRWIERLGKWWLHGENEPAFFIPSIQYDAIFYIKESKAATRLVFKKN